MTYFIEVVGWHIHPEAAACVDCGKPASYLCLDSGYTEFSLCRKCKDSNRYTTSVDKIEEIFKGLGL
jgi:hypothetical protein